MKDLNAVETFVKTWMDRPGFVLDDHGNARFRARIKYRFSDGESSHSMWVRIRRHGIDAGKVRIENSVGMLCSIPAIEFGPEAQQFDYVEDRKSLTIQGEVLKNGIRYYAEIIPT